MEEGGILSYFKRKQPEPVAPKVKMTDEELAQMRRESDERLKNARAASLEKLKGDVTVLDCCQKWGLVLVPNPPNGKPPKSVR